MGQESKCAKGQDGLLWLKLAIKTIQSNWAKKHQLGPGSSWARPILTESQIGSRSQEHMHCNLFEYGHHFMHLRSNLLHKEHRICLGQPGYFSVIR